MLETFYDIVGIGTGPFNLGLASLAAAVPDLNCQFFDQNTDLNWHPGRMMDNARLKVPFPADLVTLADPCSRFSYLCFLKAKNRLMRFAIHENCYPTRREYNEYCRWMACELSSLSFGMRCEEIRCNERLNCFDILLVNASSQPGILSQPNGTVISSPD